MASSVHGLLQSTFGHGKLITKLLINPFVNGLRLVNEIIFNSLYFVYGPGLTSDEHRVRTEVRTARTTNGSIIQGELLNGYHVYSAIWNAEIGVHAHHVFESPIINTIDMLLLC